MDTGRLIDLATIAGPLLVVPAGDRVLQRSRPALAKVAAVVFAVAFLPVATGWRAVLALPWLGVVALGAAGALRSLIERRTFDALAVLASEAFLVTAAAWATASAAGWRPLDISEPIVQLTSVHFHFAASGTTVLAIALSRRWPGPTLRAATTLAIVAPPVVASGFVSSRAVLQVGGAALMTGAAWAVAAVTLVRAVPATRGRARALLIVSGLAPFVPMVLAVAWAAANYWDVPALSVPAMVRVHGSINAIGFIGCGLMGHITSRR